MNSIQLDQLNYYADNQITNSLYGTPLSRKIVDLMERRVVAKKELTLFLRDNSTELAAYAVEKSVNWLVFSQSMKRHVKHSKLGKLLKKLDRLFVTDALPFSQLFPRPVRQTIARLYPGNLDNNSKSLIKMEQLLMGDVEYLTSYPRIQGIPLSDLVQWIDNQKVTLRTLRLELFELAYVIPKLGFVDLSYYPQELIPYMLSLMKNVSHLTCRWLNDDDLNKLTAFPYLKSLDLSGCAITDKGIESICNLTHLTSLNVSGCIDLTDASIQWLSSLSALNTLNISGCNQISYAGLKYLVKCYELKDLDVSSCNIRERELKIIGLFSSLKVLNLACCEGIKDRGIEHLRSLDLLEELNLSFLKISDLGVMYLTDFEALKVLNLKGCQKITDKAIQNLCHQSITSLGLKGCSNITDRAFKCLPILSKVLKKLDLSGCYKITDEGLYLIAEFPELTHLSLKGCNGISNAGIFYFSRIKAIER